MTACKIQVHFIHMYIYKMSFQTMDIWLDMSNGFHSAHTHCETEISTILAHLMLVCDPTFPCPLAYF